jgi:translation initiation factor IF-1
MRRDRLSRMIGGWFVGNFDPAILSNENFEVGVKEYLKGEVELTHYQKVAVEITVVISGKIRMGEEILLKGDIILLEPFEEYDFEAVTDAIVVAVKCPSLPSDKFLSH